MPAPTQGAPDDDAATELTTDIELADDEVPEPEEDAAAIVPPEPLEDATELTVVPPELLDATTSVIPPHPVSAL